MRDAMRGLRVAVCHRVTQVRQTGRSVAQEHRQDSCDQTGRGARLELSKMFDDLADEPRFVAIKESSENCRRITDIKNRCGDTNGDGLADS